MEKKSKPLTYFLAFSKMAWRGYKNGPQLHNLYYRFLLDGTRCFLPAITMLNCFGVVPSENQHQMPKSTKLVRGFNPFEQYKYKSNWESFPTQLDKHF